MYYTVVSDPYSKNNSKRIFEVYKKDFNRKINQIEKGYEDKFHEKVESKNIKELEKIKEFINSYYENLANVENKLPKVVIKNLPLLLEQEPRKPAKIALESIPKPIKRSDGKYNKQMSFVTKLFMGKIENHYKKMHEAYINDNEKWLKEYDQITVKNRKAAESYNTNYKSYMKSLEEYNKIKIKKTEELLQWEESILNADNKSLEEYLELLLSHVYFPLPKFKHEVKCKVSGRLLRIEVKLPKVENLLDIKNIRYIKIHDEIRFTKFTQTDLNKIYQVFIPYYVATLSALINRNKQYFNFEEFIINGTTEGKLKINNIIIISTKTNSENLYDVKKHKNIQNWLERTNAYVGKRLVNKVALKQVY